MSPKITISHGKGERVFTPKIINLSIEEARLLAADLMGAMALLNENMGYEGKGKEIARALLESSQQAKQ